MPDWLGQVVGGIAIAVLGAVIASLLRSWLAARRRKAMASGRAFRFDAALRGNVTPYPRHFRAGWVYVGVGPPLWKPRFGVLRRPIALPVSAVVEQIRIPRLREMLNVPGDGRILVARAGDVELELAIYLTEIETALRALESSTGGGWIVPALSTSGPEPYKGS